MDDVVQDRGVEDRRGVELFAGDGRADDGKDAGADDRADAESGERPWAERLPQPVFGLFRLPNQFVDRLAGEQLTGQ
jgi:hypothetical protein